MKPTLRSLAALFALAMCGIYALTALSGDSAHSWANAWMGPATISVIVLVAAFVLTMNRAGTRGSVLSDLGSALHRAKLRDPVEGVAQVVSASGMPRSGQNMGSAMCEMNLVISVPGQPAVAVSKASVVKLAKWPSAGAQLPVMAERSDPREFNILWDRVGTGWDVGVAQAQALADQMSSGAQAAPGGASAFGGAPTGQTGSPNVITSVTINGQPASPDDLAPFEEMTGMDLNGDGVVGRPAQADPDEPA